MPEFSELTALVKEDGDGIRDERHAPSTLRQQQIDAFMNAPIFSSSAYEFIKSTLRPGHTMSGLIPQYGLLGVRRDPWALDMPTEERLILANMNMPWSTFICGSQGAGKSHTLSCLLESALMMNNAAGKLSHPLAAMVMHYDNYSNYETTQICEAAYLCSSKIPVTVLVSPSNIWAMKRLYGNLPGLQPGSPTPRVLPLYIEEDQLNISRILKLMAVSPSAKESPLYMQVVMNVAREMAMEGPGFSYTKFRQRLSDIKWVPGQQGPLSMRLDLLDSFMIPSETTKSTRPAKGQDIWAFEPGSLTIVDLSDPFVNPNDACTLFTVCLSIFLEGRNKCGRVVALDEAHKFLGQSGEAAILTNDLTSIIRQQRHTGTRVLIATQEPTLSPVLIDLANATFVHRFLSPAWYETLKRHLAGANRKDSGDTDTLFDTIVALRTGESLLFCPTAQVGLNNSLDGSKEIQALGNSYTKVKIRKRLTTDGGRSIMATDHAGLATPQMDVESVPMHIVQPKSKTLTTPTAPATTRIATAPKTQAVPTTTVTRTTTTPPKTVVATMVAAQKVVASTVPQTVPQTINIGSTREKPSDSIKEKLDVEATRQACMVFQAHRCPTTASLPKAMRIKMNLNAEVNLRFPPGTIGNEGPWKIYFYASLNNQLEALFRSSRVTK